MTEQVAKQTIAYQITVTLQEDLHSGNGMGTTDIDALQAKDAEGRPIIDRHHFRGVLKDNALRLNHLDADLFKKETIERLFGKSGAQQSRLLDCSSLRTEDKDCLIYWDSTARQPDSRCPEDHSLRRFEFVRAGTVFTGSMLVSDANDEDLDAIELLLGFTNRLGSGRTRGNGEIRVHFERKNHQDQPSEVSQDLGGNQIKVLLVNNEPVCIPVSGHAGNIIRSESFIPGRTLFAALCANAAKLGKEKLKSMFSSGLQVGNAYPLSSDIEVQQASLEKLLSIPVPQYLYSKKAVSGKDENRDLRWPWWAQAKQDKALKQIENQLRDDRDLSDFDEQKGEKTSRPKGEQYLHRDTEGRWYRYHQPLEVRMRNFRGDPLAKAFKKNDNDLFSEQRIPAGTAFLMELQCEDQELLAEILQWLSTPGLIRIGRGKAPVSCKQWQAVDRAAETTQENDSNEVILIATSDWILRGDNLATLDSLNLSQLLHELDVESSDDCPGLNIRTGESLPAKNSVESPHDYPGLNMVSRQETELQGGFNYATRLPRKPFYVIKRGSTFRLQATEESAKEIINKIRDRGDAPLGERVKEGYGRLLIDLPVEIIDAETIKNAVENFQEESLEQNEVAND